MNTKITMLTLSLLIFLLSFVNLQAQWQLVGPQDFTSSNAENQSLAMHNGVPYIAFKDFANSLKTTVMKFDGTNWVAVGTAGFSAGLAEKQSLAISSTGEPYVAYSDYTNSQKVTVKKYNGTNWVTVGSGGITANHQSYDVDLALDNNNVPYVAYTETTGLVVKKFNGTSWVNAGNNIPNIYYTKLGFDSNNAVYICGSDGFNSKAMVYKLTGSTWSMVGLGALSLGEAWYISFAMDVDTPYVAYHDVPYAGKLTVMKYDGSNWVSVGNAGFTSAQVFYPLIRIDDNHVPYVAHYGSGFVDVLKFVGNSWVNVGQSGFTPSFTTKVDFEVQNGIPYIAYEGNSTGKATVMKYIMPSAISIIGKTESLFEITPNPVQHVLNILTEENIQQVNILNVNGQLLKSGTENFISVEELSKGIYIVELITNRGVSYKQFVVSK